MFRPHFTFLLLLLLALPLAAQRRTLELGEGLKIDFEVLLPAEGRPDQPPPLLVCLDSGGPQNRIGTITSEGGQVDIAKLLDGLGSGSLGSGLETLANAARDRGIAALRVFTVKERPFAGLGAADLKRVIELVLGETKLAPGKVAIAGTGADGWAVLALLAAEPDRFKAGLAAPSGDPGGIPLGGAHRVPLYLRIAKNAPANVREPLLALIDRQKTAGARIDTSEASALPEAPALAWLEEIWFGAAKVEVWELKSGDGMPLFGDFYAGADKKSPVILCVHARNSSAGDFARLAPRLLRAGFQVLAIDHREGGINGEGVLNRTVEAGRGKSALKGLFGIMRRDIEAGIDAVRRKGHRGPLVLLGDSTGASECLIVASKSSVVRGVVLFSPQDNISERGAVARAAENLKVPSFMTAPRQGKAEVGHLHGLVPARDKVFLPREDGIWGIDCLEKSSEGEATFRAIVGFLGRLR